MKQTSQLSSNEMLDELLGYVRSAHKLSDKERERAKRIISLIRDTFARYDERLGEMWREFDGIKKKSSGVIDHAFDIGEKADEIKRLVKLIDRDGREVQKKIASGKMEALKEDLDAIVFPSADDVAADV